ncbi:hypothetical protein BCD49_04480 [Pseudofrankia sp. EUN1h]|nr:hypothetical protein BCD49_04480 [Pseudofrankia sp. EUN1h]
MGGAVALILVLAAIGAAVGGSGDDKSDAAAATAGPSGAASPGQTVEPELSQRSYKSGHCYRWDRGGTSAKVDDVPCAEPHLFESVSDDSVDISGEFPASAPYPLTDDEWSAIYDRYCLQPVQAYLGYPLDPHGRFSVSTIVPTTTGWIQGDRKIDCGIGGYAPTPENPDNDLFTGSAKGADQSMVYPVGTCMAKSTDGTKPVACSAPHQHVAIGDVHFTDPPGAAPPADTAFDERAGQQCAVVARAFFGPSFQQTSTVSIGWFPIDPESWQAGSRSFSCLVSYYTDAGDPRSVTGDARNPVPA